MTRMFGSHSSDSSVDAFYDEADAVVLPRLDEVGGHPRPANIGVTYAEGEYHALADEQEHAWPAEGEREARSSQVRARGLDPAAAATEFLLAENRKDVQQAHADHQHAVRVLAPYVRREPWAKLRYWLCWPVLWFGDTAGVWSAAITHGDLPSAAFGQALAAGLAAACAGLVGSEIKDIRMAAGRRRDPESLTTDEQRYSRLFAGEDQGVGIVKLVAFLSVMVAALVAVGISTLRSGIEGSSAGLTFGLLAVATALASALLGYSAADEVADQLATAAKRVRRAEKRHVQLATASPPKMRAEADETARSIKAEYALRGRAASKRVESLAMRVMRRNPQVLGHGYPAGEQSGVVGRRARRNGAT
jgi:hypothetical protein